jgi:hypothetical protein
VLGSDHTGTGVMLWVRSSTTIVYTTKVNAGKKLFGEVGNRTPDLVHAKHALYQLSYIPFGA